MTKYNYSRICSETGCTNKYHARDRCLYHYNKTDFKKAVNIAYRKRNPEKRAEWRRGHALRHRGERAAYLKEYARTHVSKRRGLIAERIKRYGVIPVELINNFDNKICGICSLYIESKYEIDHIIPLAKNGTHTLDNLQLTHPICNRTKNARLQKDMKLDIMILRELIMMND